MGIMENRMETTRMENHIEKKMENEMEIGIMYGLYREYTGVLYRGYIGVMKGLVTLSSSLSLLFEVSAVYSLIAFLVLFLPACRARTCELQPRNRPSAE